MKKRKTPLTLFALLCYMTATAQMNLEIKQTDNSITRIPFSEFKKITFDDVQMTVQRKDLSSSVFALNSLSMFSFNDLSTSTNRELGTITITLFPNPVADVLHIRLSGSSQAFVSIYSLTGQLLLSTPITTTNEQGIPLSHLSSGVYLCKVQQGHYLHISQFIKQ